MTSRNGGAGAEAIGSFDRGVTRADRQDGKYAEGSLLTEDALRAIGWWMWPSLIGLVLGPAIGVIQSVQFTHPRAMEWLSGAGLAYSQLRVMHTNVVVYAWLVMAFVAVALYIIPHVTKQPLSRRRTETVYISLWYLLAACFGTLFAFVAINFLTPMIQGVGNVYLQGWWIHNAVGLIITPLGIGLAYYVIPKTTGRPIFSHRLDPRVTGRQIAHRGALSLAFWAVTAVFPVFFAFFTVSGLTAAASSNLLGLTVYEAIPAQMLPRLFRTVTGALLMIGWWTFAWTLWSSRRKGLAFREGMDEVAAEADRLPVGTEGRRIAHV